jgi:endonuclease-3
MCAALEASCGKREPTSTHGDPLDEIVLEVLSEDSTNKDAARAFRELRRAFVDWNEVRVSRPGEIQQVLEPLEGAASKARRIQQMLDGLFRRRSALSLSFLLDAGPREARDFLGQLEGVGEEFAARVMLHSLGYPAVAVTPAVARVSQRVGLVGEEFSVEDIRRRLAKIVLKERMCAFHTLVSDHARRACLVTSPKCGRCVLRRLCQTGRAWRLRHARTGRRARERK